MKTTNLIKAFGSLVIIAAAVAAASPSDVRADDNIHKRGARDFAQPTARVVIVEKKAAPACVACRNEYTPTVTQDSKLKTKTIVLRTHLCTSCKTLVASGPKSAPKETVTHSCLAAGNGKCCN
jgi:hypothetical protein